MLDAAGWRPGIAHSNESLWRALWIPRSTAAARLHSTLVRHDKSTTCTSCCFSELGRDTNHPSDTESVGNHTEARRPESLRQRHLYLTVLCQSSKFSVSLCFIWHCERERKTLEVGLPRAVPIGSHHRCIANPKTDVHNLVLRTRRNHSRLWRFGTILKAHEHGDLGPESFLVKFQCFLAAAIEEQIDFDLHDTSSEIGFSVCSPSLA